MSNEKKIDAILIHGMGRTPVAMSILAARLQASNIRPHLFGYSVTFEKWDECIRRYENFITKRTQNRDYIVVGHSLGTVLTRAVLAQLMHKPLACFFLAPPTQVTKAARNFAHRHMIQLFMGDIGKVLADQQFMETLPMPSVPTKIYAGVAGPRGRYSPFGEEPNDGLLTVKETQLPSIPLQTVPSLHTFIMNSKVVTKDIVQITRSYSALRI
ncbi:MAG: alpha/beta hydrolase [Anaerolineales bacterium]|nr:alpha/beta hydrolase [Anaerolineales bacterium]